MYCGRENTSVHVKRLKETGEYYKEEVTEDIKSARTIRKHKESVRCTDLPLVPVHMLGKIKRLGNKLWALCEICAVLTQFEGTKFGVQGFTCGRHDDPLLERMMSAEGLFGYNSSFNDKESIFSIATKPFLSHDITGEDATNRCDEHDPVDCSKPSTKWKILPKCFYCGNTNIGINMKNKKYTAYDAVESAQIAAFVVSDTDLDLLQVKVLDDLEKNVYRYEELHICKVDFARCKWLFKKFPIPRKSIIISTIQKVNFKIHTNT